MASEFERFRAIVMDDAALQAELWSIADPSTFVARVVVLGAERGLRFLPDDVWSAYHEGRSAWLAIWSP